MRHKLITFFFIGGTAVLAGSPALMSFLDRWEGHRSVAYADKLAGGTPTVCRGVTNYTSPYPVVVGERWSNDRCREVEQQIVIDTQRELQKCITHAIPQSTFDALTSHAYNFGWPRTCASESVKAINAGDIRRGCNLLAYKPDGTPNWSNVGTKFVQGLHSRRKAETKLCLRDLP